MQRAQTEGRGGERRGYASLAYARSLASIGTPLDVETWGTAVLLRAIPSAPGRFDATGPYPVCALSRSVDLRVGLDVIRATGAVSLVLVADPLQHPDPGRFQDAFTAVRPFKTHHVIDRQAGPFAPSRHHADRIRRGRRRCTARRVSLREPLWLAAWQRLYAGLVVRNGISGLQAFDTATFAALAALPEDVLVAFAAEDPSGGVLAMQLWIRDGDRAYSHLTATSEAGYRAGATYVVYTEAIEHLGDCMVLDLGGGAGMVDDPTDSLALFKRGFANATRMAHLCCAILDAEVYHRLKPPHEELYFPAYRAPGWLARGARGDIRNRQEETKAETGLFTMD